MGTPPAGDRLKWNGTGESYSPRVCFIVRKLSAKAKVEQWIKEGKYALNWMRLS